MLSRRCVTHPTLQAEVLQQGLQVFQRTPRALGGVPSYVCCCIVAVRYLNPTANKNSVAIAWGEEGVITTLSTVVCSTHHVQKTIQLVRIPILPQKSRANKPKFFRKRRGREGGAVEVERVMVKRIKHAVLNRADVIHRSTRCAPAPLMMPCCKKRLNSLSFLLQFFLTSQASLSAFCCIFLAV